MPQLLTAAPSSASSKLLRAPVVLHARVVTGPGGGPEKTILNSPRFLQPHGYDVPCVYLHPPNDHGFESLQQRAEEANAELIGVPDRGMFDLKVIRRLVTLCRERSVDIWHGHDYKTNALGLILRRFHPMHLVTTTHGWVHFTAKTRVYYQIDRWCMKRYDQVICVSDDLHAACLQAGMRPERCTVIENAIDTEDFRRTQSVTAAKQQFDLPKCQFLLGAVGRLSAEKGFDLLIRCVDRLIASGLDVGLVIVGGGDEFDSLQRLIRELGREDRIRLLGFRSEIKTLFQALDLFVLSSLREGLPNVVLEAMALETPIVATKIAGVPKVIQHEHNGLLVEPSEPAELQAAIQRMLQQPQLRRQCAAAARATIEQRYSFAARMEKMRRLYEQVLQS